VVGEEVPRFERSIGVMVRLYAERNELFHYVDSLVDLKAEERLDVLKGMLAEIEFGDGLGEVERVALGMAVEEFRRHYHRERGEWTVIAPKKPDLVTPKVAKLRAGPLALAPCESLLSTARQVGASLNPLARYIRSSVRDSSRSGSPAPTEIPGFRASRAKPFVLLQICICTISAQRRLKYKNHSQSLWKARLQVSTNQPNHPGPPACESCPRSMDHFCAPRFSRFSSFAPRR
jgi:hypothetical protein